MSIECLLLYFVIYSMILIFRDDFLEYCFYSNCSILKEMNISFLFILISPLAMLVTGFILFFEKENVLYTYPIMFAVFMFLLIIDFLIYLFNFNSKVNKK